MLILRKRFCDFNLEIHQNKIAWIVCIFWILNSECIYGFLNNLLYQYRYRPIWKKLYRSYPASGHSFFVILHTKILNSSNIRWLAYACPTIRMYLFSVQTLDGLVSRKYEGGVRGGGKDDAEVFITVCLNNLLVHRYYLLCQPLYLHFFLPTSSDWPKAKAPEAPY